MENVGDWQLGRRAARKRNHSGKDFSYLRGSGKK